MGAHIGPGLLGIAFWVRISPRQQLVCLLNLPAKARIQNCKRVDT